MTNGYYLRHLKIVNRKRTIFDIDFLGDNIYSNDKPLSTVIIGTNGAGKSYLLTLIAEVYRAIENKRNNRDYTLRYEYYKIEYSIHNISYVIEIYKKRFKYKKENVTVNMNELILPNKVLAVSFMVNDKFTFATDDTDSDKVYEYLGVRRTSNATWTNSVERRISDALVKNYKNRDFYIKVKKILDFLGFKQHISLIFEPSTKTFFKRKITYQKLSKKVDSYKRSEDYRALSINKIREEDIMELVKFINETTKTRTLTNENNKTSIKYFIDLESDELNLELSDDYKNIQRLIDLRLINSPILKLYKEDEFEFEFASSGEKQFLFTMINIASKLEPHSIVLVDEPELSFHPNWQMLYINYLKKIFIEFSSCHFILATHSHYIISDLEKESSSIVILNPPNKENGEREAQLVNHSTYAWSAESILYNIFQVRTTRNHYFEMDLRRLVKLVRDKSKDTEELVFLIEKLSKYVFDNNDPINVILEDAERYLKNVTRAD